MAERNLSIRLSVVDPTPPKPQRRLAAMPGGVAVWEPHAPCQTITMTDRHNIKSGEHTHNRASSPGRTDVAKNF